MVVVLQYPICFISSIGTFYDDSFLFFSPSLEIDLLSPLTNSPLDFNVRVIFTPDRHEAFLFGRAITDIRASEELLQNVIVNVESNDEFVIKTRIRIMSSQAGALFSIVHLQRKLFLLDLSCKGIGEQTKLILRYRSVNDTSKSIVFKNVAALGDRKYHTVIIRVSDVFDNGKKISAVSLFVDCKLFGRVDTVSPISASFSYKGTLLSLMDFRIGQRRGAWRKPHTKWMVRYLFIIVCNNKRLENYTGGGANGLISGGEGWAYKRIGEGEPPDL